MRPKQELFGLGQNQRLLIIIRIPSPQWSILQQGQGNCSELRNKQIQGNSQWQPAPVCKNLSEHWHKFEYKNTKKNRHRLGKSYSTRPVSQQLLWDWWHRAIRNSVKQMSPGLSGLQKPIAGIPNEFRKRNIVWCSAKKEQWDFIHFQTREKGWRGNENKYINALSHFKVQITLFPLTEMPSLIEIKKKNPII